MSFKHLRINPRRPGAPTGLGLERVSLPEGYENAVWGRRGTRIGWFGAVNPQNARPSPIRLKETGSPSSKRTRKQLKRAAHRRLTRTIAR